MKNTDIGILINSYIDTFYKNDNSYFFCGGCTAFASALFHFLKNKNVDVEYICIANNCHDCVRVGDIYFDADGYFNSLSKLINNSSLNCDYVGAIKDMNITNEHVMIEGTPCYINEAYYRNPEIVREYINELQETYKILLDNKIFSNELIKE